MADTDTLEITLPEKDWREIADAGLTPFTAQNRSSLDMYLRASENKPTAEGGGHPIRPSRTLGRLNSSKHWLWSSTADCIATITIDDRT